MALAPGTKLHPYDIVALGAGAMDEMHRARGAHLNRAAHTALGHEAQSAVTQCSFEIGCSDPKRCRVRRPPPPSNQDLHEKIRREL
jgi:hypothetical protein